MLQPGTIDTKENPVATVQSSEPSSAIMETSKQLLDHIEPLNSVPLERNVCASCKLPIVYNDYSISNPHRRRIICLGCNK